MLKRNHQLAKYQAAQLPGIVNPIVYPRMYQMQVEKWEKIGHWHLLAVTDSVDCCFKSILDSELEKFLQNALAQSYKEAEAHHERACRHETKCTMLQTKAPGFSQQVLGWRQLRFFQATQAARAVDTTDIGNHAVFINYFHLIHPSLEKNMVQDVHDILKVYYKIALEAFIHNMTHSIVEDFISNEKGPIKSLNTDWVLGLDEEQLGALCREDERIIERRSVLGSEIKRLWGALTIVDKARQQTADLEKY